MLHIDANTGNKTKERFDSARIFALAPGGYTLAVRKREKEGAEAPWEKYELIGGKIGDHPNLRWETPPEAVLREGGEEAFKRSRTILSVTHSLERARTFLEGGRVNIPLFPTVVVRRNRRVHLFFFYTDDLHTLPYLEHGDAIGGECSLVETIDVFLGMKTHEWKEVLKDPLGNIKDADKKWPDGLFQPSHAYYFCAGLQALLEKGFDLDSITK